MRKAYNHQQSLFCQWPDHQYSKELRVIDEILSTYPQFVLWAHKDLTQGKKHKETGACGMTAEQVLRAAIVKQQNGWSYEFLALQCVDSDMTKSFVKLDFGESYSASCLQENISKIRAQTWSKIFEGVVCHGRDEKIDTGRTVRMDATVIESNIHYPTDSTLLQDCIDVVNRALKVIRKDIKGIRLYAKMSEREAKRQVLRIVNAKNNRQRKASYKNLLRGAKSIRDQLPRLIAKIERYDLSDDAKLNRQLEDLHKIADLLPHIIHQTEERVIRGKSVAVEDKIASIFEPHTDIIVKGKRPPEFGHKVFFTAGKSGLLLDCQLVQGNPADSDYFMDLVERQQVIFSRPPRQTSADGGFASEDNVYDAKEFGVKDVCFSKPCGMQIEEMVKSPWVFQKLRNFRAGIEGIISVLKRGFGLTRAMWKGVKGFAAYVHSAVVAYNLTVIARHKLKAANAS